MRMGGGKNTSLKPFTRSVMKSIKYSLFMMASVLLMNLASCKNLDDIYDRLDNVETKVSDLETALTALKDSYNQAKIIKTVAPLSDGRLGWLVVFTDNTEIEFVDGVVADVTKNDTNGVITIKLNDGSSFWFNTLYVTPASIAILRTNPIELTFGSRDTVEFRVNPSNASFKIAGDECDLVLDKIGIIGSRSFNVSKPVYYKLVGVEPVSDKLTNEIKIGQYRAIIEDQKVSAEYREMVALVLNAKDVNKNDVEISSSAFEVNSRIDSKLKTGLPIIFINTPNSAPILSKEEYIIGSTITLYNSDLNLDCQGEMKIKGRGNSTWQLPKKPYKFKFNDKNSLLGMPKDKEWVMLANYYDRSLLRTSLTFFLANEFCDFDYVPRFQHINLELNGLFQGCYQLGEQVKISKDRVNVGSDGFLLEIDCRAEPSDVTFNTDNINRPINIKEPELALNDDDYNYVKDYVQKAENILYSENYLDTECGYQSVLDINSFVDWYIIEEISKNRDSNTDIMGTSIYMHVVRNGKIFMGPLWDFDLAYGNSGYWESDVYKNFWIKDSFWYKRLFTDPIFVSKVKERFDVIYNHKQDIMQYIDENSADLRSTAINNCMEWYNLSTVEDAESNYDYWIVTLKQWLNNRLDWLKTEFDKM